jgi:hypothetical protein
MRVFGQGEKQKQKEKTPGYFLAAQVKAIEQYSRRSVCLPGSGLG